MDKSVEKILIDYVTEQVLDIEAIRVIGRFCSEQQPLSNTVFRGHNNEPTSINKGLWHSATTDINIASTEFSGRYCCIFIIHLLDVPYIDINKLIGDKIGDKKDEKEIIFLGGGKFYKNDELTEEGYLELGSVNRFNKLMFECWYSLPELQSKIEAVSELQPKISNVERALSIIDPEEYDLITSVNDIVLNDNTILLTHDEKQQLFNEIQKMKSKGGKKRNKLRKTKKKKKKRNKTCKKMRLKYKKV